MSSTIQEGRPGLPYGAEALARSPCGFALLRLATGLEAGGAILVLEEANAAFGCLVGLAGEDLAGRALADLPGLGQAPLLEALGEVARTGGSRQVAINLPPRGTRCDVHAFSPEATLCGAFFQVSAATPKDGVSSPDSEAMFRAVAEHSAAMIYVAQGDHYLYANPTFLQVMGYTLEELQGLDFWALVHPDQREVVKERGRARLRGENPPAHYEIKVVTKGGETRWMDYSGSRIIFQGEPAVIGVVLDITDRKRDEEEMAKLQAQLFHSAKLASLGTLASGAAHEIKNPLAIMSGNLTLLRQHLRNQGWLDSRVEHYLAKQEKAVARAARIVEGMRLQARADVLRREVVDLHRLVEQVVAFCGLIYEQSEVEIQVRLGSEAPYVMGDPDHLKQVVMNLLSNARDALWGRRAGRRIEIETGGDEDQVWLSVSDNGCGIAPERRERIFDPFFTTKEPGRGTGLGLAITHSIVTALEGRITVDSTPEVGSRFRVTLPRARSVPPQPQATREVPRTAEVRGKVLVVDDEADLREVLRIYLEGLGFEVAEAADGLSALEMLRVEQFDHVITDLVMPRMNGYMLIDEARRLTPRGRLGPRFVVVTGSAALDDLPAGPSGVSEHVHGYLRKPFDMDQLLDLLS